MKKKLLLLALLSCNIRFTSAQSLTNWTHYYATPYSNFNLGNNVASAGPEETILLDRSTLSYTRYPFPDAVRYVNLHNSYDTVTTYSCLPSVGQGPGASLLLNGCAGIIYQFDGTNYTPFTGYIGHPADSASFLPFSGGSVFFTSPDDKLHKYDGATETIFDLSNSPYTNTAYYYLNTTVNDDIFMVGTYNIAVYHSGSWTTYDTTFFHQPGMSVSAISTSPGSDYTFYDNYDSSLYTFRNGSGSWSSVQLPSAMMHASLGYYASSSVYDNSGNLWLTGDSLFCRYNGSTFTDYFALAAMSGCNSSGMSFISSLSGNKILFTDGYHNYIADPVAMTAYRYDDPHAVLSANQLLPSLKDVNGTLWFGACVDYTEHPLMKYDGGNWSTPDLSSVFYGAIYTMRQDTGQAIVLAGAESITSDGPVILNDTSVSLLDPTYSYYKTVEALSIDQNHHYWYGGPGPGIVTGIAEYDGASVTYHFNPAPGCSNDAYALDIDSLGNKWVGYTSWDGAYKYNGSTWTVYNTSNSPLPSDTLDKIIRQPNTNIMWFCTSAGFAKLANGTWTVYNMSNSPLPSDKSEYIYFADDGSTWFGTQNGFACLHGSTWEVYTTSNSQLHNSDVESIVLDNECNVWIATENGLSMAHNLCASAQGIHISGNVYHPGNVPATSTMVYVYKLNSTGSDVQQIENVFTDNTGKFYYTAPDTGTYFFDAAIDQGMFPSEITSYHDSALVIQQSAPVHVVADGNYTNNIWFRKAVSASGSCMFKGKLNSSTERTGSVRVVLMYAGKPVTSVLSNMDGSFTFSNIAAQNYSIWIDKYGLNNTLAPSVTVNCATGSIVNNFSLYPDHVISVNDIAANDADHFNIFPNPFSDQFHIRIDAKNAESAQLMIADISGKVIFEKGLKLTTGENELSVDGSDYAQGIYFVRIRTATKTFSGKLVK